MAAYLGVVGVFTLCFLVFVLAKWDNTEIDRNESLSSMSGIEWAMNLGDRIGARIEPLLLVLLTSAWVWLMCWVMRQVVREHARSHAGK